LTDIFPFLAKKLKGEWFQEERIGKLLRIIDGLKAGQGGGNQSFWIGVKSEGIL